MNLNSTQWPAFSRLIDLMLDQPEEQRVAWVRALRGEDAALAPQLLALLETTNRTRVTTWFDTLPKLSEWPAQAGTDPLPLADQPGDEIGPYRLVRLIATGGMGSVWYAERSDRLVRRAVALKLPLSAPSVSLAARFERERDILAGLAHPHIARLYDAGVSGDGRAYLALEYVEGRNLDSFCDERRLGLQARIDLFKQVLNAVQYAHSRLVVHRDLKPSNILVTSEGYVRLLDFGVAKLLDATEPVDNAELTRLGAPAMTPAYAAPEQILGQSVSTATDVYALGVVLYELLTGTRPYRIKRNTRGAVEEAILMADIPLPSAANVTAEAAAARSGTPAQLRRALRGDLDAILLKALQRDPAQRYATVAAFADDLLRYRSGNSVMAHRPSRWYEFRKFVVRNRLVVTSAAAVGVALVLGTGVALWQAREAQQQTRIAELERDHALSAAEHREAVEEFLSDLLVEAGRTGRPISIPALIERADELSARQFRENPEARAAVLKTVAEFEEQFQSLQKALSYMDRARELLANTPDTALRDSVVCAQALLHGVTGQAEEAQRRLAQVIDEPATLASARSECLGDRAQLALYRHDGATAAVAAGQALEQWALSAHRSRLKQMELRVYRAEARAYTGKPAEADSEYAQIMNELRDLGRDRGPLGITVRWERMDTAIDSGDAPLALSMIDDLMELLAQDVPERAPILLFYERGGVLADLGRYAEALVDYQKAVALAATQDHNTERLATLQSAVATSRLGNSAEAERLFHRAVGMAHRDSIDVGKDVSSLMVRAKLDLDRGDFSDARVNLDKALLADGATAVTFPTLYRLLAIADLGLGEPDAAAQAARLAVDASERLKGDKPASIWLGEAQLVLGQVLQEKGDAAGARRALGEAEGQLGRMVDAVNPDLQLARSLLRSAG